jgi:hypothetical protein
MRIHNVFHFFLLNPVSSDPMPGQHPPSPLPVVVNEEEEYLVEKILDSRIRHQKLEFVVKWSGYETPTWEPLACVNNSAALDKFIAQIQTNPNQPSEAVLRPACSTGG